MVDPSFDPGGTPAALLNHLSGSPHGSNISERFDCFRISKASDCSVARRVFPGSKPPCMEDEESACGSKTDSANACLMVPPLYLTGGATVNLDDTQSTTTTPSSRFRDEESHGRQSQGRVIGPPIRT
jgi:hypothetical protein